VNISKRLVIIIASFLLAACQTTEMEETETIPTRMVWLKDGTSQQDLNQDNYQCLQEAQQQTSNTYIPPSADQYSAAHSSSSSVTNVILFEACLNARGWKKCPECKP